MHTSIANQIKLNREQVHRFSQRREELVENFFTDHHASEVIDFLFKTMTYREMRSHDWEIRRLASFISDLERLHFSIKAKRSNMFTKN